MLTVKDIREAVDEVYKAVDYFSNHDVVYDLMFIEPCIILIVE